ncbi:carboxypeptidase O-like [Bufo gargarizans]|uniref:carboxypeptidase O-like n=1 Tax=Bufo gargarizans TaxID=30331 RepID=UPI001CF14882|nr:carboxypeptidase O-like [Bufo gargarizans]
MKYVSWTICLLGFLLYEGRCVKVKYDGDQVLKVTPQTPQQVQYLQELSVQWRLDLWKPDIIQDIYPGGEAHIRVQSVYVQKMKESLVQQHIPFKIMIEDVQKLIDRSSVSLQSTGPISLENYDYTIYHPMNEIYEWMDRIKDKYNNVVTKHLLGHTYEEKPIYYFKMGLPSKESKKVVFLDCGIHAREWIAVAYCQWFMKEILARQPSDRLIRKLLRQVDFYVIPVLNIDGYVYTWTTERLWRKNRSPQNNGTCFGVDLNRNFDAHWCTVGADADCESYVFCGPSAASELETKSVVKLFEQVKSNMLMYLSVHNYGKYILLPYGYTTNQSAYHNEMETAANKAIEKMKKEHNNEYTVGSASLILYSTSGTSGDWAADNNVTFSYTYELRDDGEFGFELPPDQIQPTCEETFTSMLALFEYLDENYLEPLDDLDGSAVAIGSLWLNTLVSISVCVFYALTW